MTPTKRDYYEILGVPKSADESQIKQAYRALAKKHHPDMNREEPKAAEEKFKELSEAYEVLMDKKKRANYDQFGHAGVDPSFGAGGFDFRRDFTHSDDIQDIFGSLFGAGGGGGSIFDMLFGGGMGGGTRTRGGRQEDIDMKAVWPRTLIVTAATASVVCAQTGDVLGIAPIDRLGRMDPARRPLTTVSPHGEQHHQRRRHPARARLRSRRPHCTRPGRSPTHVG